MPAPTVLSFMMYTFQVDDVTARLRYRQGNRQMKRERAGYLERFSSLYIYITSPKLDTWGEE